MRVDYDHTELLGDTLSSIAQQKAGIIKPGAPCVLYADNDAEVYDVIRRRCAETHSISTDPGQEPVGIVAAQQIQHLLVGRNAVGVIQPHHPVPEGFAVDGLEGQKIQTGLGDTIVHNAVVFVTV